ncbi:MAG TPA: hypothetical protein VE964_17030, partial [Myxococcales bacterium]|nr:hypothetical protein [Myxococcales bacterium]
RDLGRQTWDYLKEGANDLKKVGSAILPKGADTTQLNDKQKQLNKAAADYASQRAGINNTIETGGDVVPPGYGPAGTTRPLVDPSTLPVRGTHGVRGTDVVLPPGIAPPPARDPNANNTSAFRGAATGAAYDPNLDPNRAPPPPGAVDWIDQARKLQFQNLSDLMKAARGEVPSAAEIQGQNMAARAAAQQFGLAAALQGGHSAASTMRRGQMGAADVAAKAREDSAALRAQEMANARNQLTSAITGIRGSEQDLFKSQAELNQQDRHDLLVAQLQAMGLSLDSAKAIADAQARAEAAKLSFEGSIIQAAPAVIGAVA